MPSWALLLTPSALLGMEGQQQWSRTTSPSNFTEFLTVSTVKILSGTKINYQTVTGVPESCLGSSWRLLLAGCQEKHPWRVPRTPWPRWSSWSLGDVCASASVKSMRPMTSITADLYSWNMYLRLKPGIKAPIIITGRTWWVMMTKQKPINASLLYTYYVKKVRYVLIAGKVSIYSLVY